MMCIYFGLHMPSSCQHRDPWSKPVELFKATCVALGYKRPALPAIGLTLARETVWDTSLE